MTLDQLRIFVEVAERQHLTQAADVLALTPSAVSASIRVLEERYGTRLFDRVGRRIEVNEMGRIFLVEAKATLSRARAAELTLSELGGLMRGTLTVQASQTIASYWLPPLLVKFRQTYPLIEINLTVGNTENVARSILDGDAVLGFIEGKIDEPDLEILAIDEDKIIAVVAPEHPWAGKKRITPKDLLTGKWILREPGSGTRSAFKALLDSNGINIDDLQVELTLPSNEAVRSAVMTGKYVTVVSELVVSSHLKAGLLVKVNIELPRRSFFLLRHKERFKTKASAALEKIINEN
jgi:DNA-binding transcriptional LysR family regulator